MIPFLKSVKMSLSNCLLSVGRMVLIKYSSNTLRLRKFSGALVMMVHVNLWVGSFFKCLAGFVKTFISKLNYFTNEKCKFNVVWNTRKVQSLFPLKDKVDHYSCVIYLGDCSYDQNYIGETVRMLKYDGMNTKTK